MHRIYSPSQNISGGKIIIRDKEPLHYLKDVLRLKVKEQLTVFDELANEYLAELEDISQKSLILSVKEKRKVTTPQRDARLTIACAIPKKSKLEDIIDKLTQLGADKIIPLETGRVIVRLDKHKKIARLRRWEKVALNAAQQSQRNTLPIIDPVKNIKEVIAGAGDYDLKLIPTLAAKGKKSLREVFSQAQPQNILVLIGPEGDFTPEEVGLALKAGFIPITLGDLVLRVETAAVAVAAFIRLYEKS